MGKRRYRRWTLEQKMHILEEIENARRDSYGSVQDILDKYDIRASHIAAFERELSDLN